MRMSRVRTEFLRSIVSRLPNTSHVKPLACILHSEPAPTSRFYPSIIRPVGSEHITDTIFGFLAGNRLTASRSKSWSRPRKARPRCCTWSARGRASSRTARAHTTRVARLSMARSGRSSSSLLQCFGFLATDGAYSFYHISCLETYADCGAFRVQPIDVHTAEAN